MNQSLLLLLIAFALTATNWVNATGAGRSKFHFKLGEITPQEKAEKASVSWARGENFSPVPGMSVSLDRMWGPKGQVRVPHWHATTELHYLLEGSVRVQSVFNGFVETFELQPGDVFLSPEGYYHFFEKTSEEKVVMVSLFASEDVKTFDLTVAMGMLKAIGSESKILEKTFGVETAIINSLYTHSDEKNKENFALPRDDYVFNMRAYTSRTRCFFVPNLDDRERKRNEYFPQTFAYFATQPWFKHMEDISFVHLTLKPGSMREPQWMNIGSELLFVTKGRVEFGVVGSRSEKHIINKYNLGWTPQGFVSYIYNMDQQEDAEVLLMYLGGAPEYSSLREMYTHTPNEVLSTIHRVPAETFEDFKPLRRTMNAETFTADKEECPKTNRQKLRQIG